MVGFFRGTVTSLMLFPTALAAQDFEKGVSAFMYGDFATALRELSPLAEQGDAPAQWMLGLANEDGRGVPRDDAVAAKWYRLAAVQG